MKVREETHGQLPLKIPMHGELNEGQQSGTFSPIGSLSNFEICNLSLKTGLREQFWNALCGVPNKPNSDPSVALNHKGRFWGDPGPLSSRENGPVFENSYMKTRLYMEYKPLEAHRLGNLTGAQKWTTYGKGSSWDTRLRFRAFRDTWGNNHGHAA